MSDLKFTLMFLSIIVGIPLLIVVIGLVSLSAPWERW